MTYPCQQKWQKESLGQDLHLDVDEHRIHCGIVTSWMVKNPTLSSTTEGMTVMAASGNSMEVPENVHKAVSSSTQTCLLLKLYIRLV